MDLDELRSVRRTEREKDSLQHLRESFYQDVAAYLADLEARRNRAAAEADDPFASPEVRQLTDKIETAEEVSEAIYERRVGKIVKQASFAAADMTADRDGLTAEEAELFDDLVERIKQNKATVLDTLAGETDASGGAEESAADSGADVAPSAGSPAEQAPAPSADAPTAGESSAGGGVLAEAMGGDGPPEGEATEHDPVATHAGEATPEQPHPSGETVEQPDQSADSQPADPSQTADSSHATDSSQRTADGPRQTRSDDGDAETTPTTDGGSAQVQRTTVRITRDVGEILGVDEREYDLEREDVVTLPKTNAEPLVDRDAAEPLD